MVTEDQYQAARTTVDRLIQLNSKYGFTLDGQFLEPDSDVTINREHLQNVIGYLDQQVKELGVFAERLHEIVDFVAHGIYPVDPDHCCADAVPYY